jgi:hypothetical protein
MGRDRAGAGFAGLAALAFAAYATYDLDLEGPVTVLAVVGGLLVTLALVGHRLVEFRYKELALKFWSESREAVADGDRPTAIAKLQTMGELDPGLARMAQRELTKLEYEELVLSTLEADRRGNVTMTNTGVDAIVNVGGVKVGVELKAGPRVRIRPLAWYLASDGGCDAVLFIVRPDVADSPELLALDRYPNAEWISWQPGDPWDNISTAIDELARSQAEP